MEDNRERLIQVLGSSEGMEIVRRCGEVVDMEEVEALELMILGALEAGSKNKAESLIVLHGLLLKCISGMLEDIHGILGHATPN